MECKDCKWFKKTYADNGYCSLWDMYINTYNGCDDFDGRKGD